MNNDWERLYKVIELSGLSINKFAKDIGLKRSENLYRIKNNKNSISKDLAELITIKYCNISKAWLLNGEGPMYKDIDNAEKGINEIDSKKIPIYDTIIYDSTINDIKWPRPLYYIDVPTLANCDLATLFIGESMKPIIPSGSIVTLKEIDLSLILPGEMYMIITDKYTTIKYIRTVSGNEQIVRLVPCNTNDFDETSLDKSLIRRIFLVKGVISPQIL